MIPIPPSHCVNWRQIARPCGSSSTSRDDAAAGGAEAGHALEVGVDRAVELRVAGEDVGQRAERRGGEPRQRDDEEALADAEPVLAARGVGDAPRRCRAAIAPAARNGQTATRRSRSRRRPGGATARLRYASSVPTTCRAPTTSTASSGGRRSARPRSAGAHSAFSTSGTRRDSVKMIARSPGRRTSSPRGKTACAVADDRADQRAADRHVLEASCRRTRCPAAS